MSATLAPHPAVKNALLAALSAQEYEHLRPHLELVTLPPGKVLYDCGEPIRYVYFPGNSIIFLLATMADGATAEVGVIGYEGMLGISVFMGGHSTPSQAIVLLAHEAVRMRAEVLRAEFERGGSLRALLLRYMHTLFVQVSQTAACNRIHHIDERLARWLLMMHDRAQTDDLPLTQEFIANMLGTHRPYITTAAGLLQKQGLIQCGRGLIKILDRHGLEACACECYGIIKAEFSHLIGGAPCAAPYKHTAAGHSH